MFLDDAKLKINGPFILHNLNKFCSAEKMLKSEQQNC